MIIVSISGYLSCEEIENDCDSQVQIFDHAFSALNSRTICVCIMNKVKAIFALKVEWEQCDDGYDYPAYVIPLKVQEWMSR